MGHKFERVRMEPQPDGAAMIGIAIVATVGATDEPDQAFSASAQWVYCREAHAHAWDVCDVTALFNIRDKDEEDVDIVGTSKRDQLESWLQSQRDYKALNLPKEIKLPTRKVQKDGKEVDEDIKEITL